MISVCRSVRVPESGAKLITGTFGPIGLPSGSDHGKWLRLRWLA